MDMTMLKSTTSKSGLRTFVRRSVFLCLSIFISLAVMASAEANISKHALYEQIYSSALIADYTDSHQSFPSPRYAQSSNFRSKSEVISEVKRKNKGAKILRIRLDAASGKYKVRILMPSGKVRSIQVSAKK